MSKIYLIILVLIIGCANQDMYHLSSLEWHCTQYKERSRSIVVPVGKEIPQDIKEDCVQWMKY